MGTDHSGGGGGFTAPVGERKDFPGAGSGQANIN
jgi:hypothetical protein